MVASLAEHPAVLRRLAAEQAAVVAAHGPALSPAALAAAPYASAVVRETLRWAPAVPSLSFVGKGHRIRAGMG
jgi:cytochrome P450